MDEATTLGNRIRPGIMMTTTSGGTLVMPVPDGMPTPWSTSAPRPATRTPLAPLAGE